MTKFTLLKNTVINGVTCETGSEVEIDESNKEYVEMLLADGNITTERAARRVDVDETQTAVEEAPATEAPLEEGSDEQSLDPSAIVADADLQNPAGDTVIS